MNLNLPNPNWLTPAGATSVGDSVKQPFSKELLQLPHGFKVETEYLTGSGLLVFKKHNKADTTLYGVKLYPSEEAYTKVPSVFRLIKTLKTVGLLSEKESFLSEPLNSHQYNRTKSVNNSKLKIRVRAEDSLWFTNHPTILRASFYAQQAIVITETNINPLKHIQETEEIYGTTTYPFDEATVTTKYLRNLTKITKTIGGITKLNPATKDIYVLLSQIFSKWEIEQERLWAYAETGFSLGFLIDAIVSDIELNELNDMKAAPFSFAKNLVKASLPDPFRKGFEEEQ